MEQSQALDLSSYPPLGGPRSTRSFNFYLGEGHFHTSYWMAFRPHFRYSHCLVGALMSTCDCWLRHDLEEHLVSPCANPVAGYTIIGFFGPVISSIISIGMANVVGAVKKSCTAAAIFVAYRVGNVSLALLPHLFNPYGNYDFIVPNSIPIDYWAAVDQVAFS